MNECTCNTSGHGRPRRNRPTDAEIAEAVDLLLGDVQLLQIAAMVCDEHVCNELSGSKFGNKGESQPYWLGQDQVDGITYMTDHVRTLALNLQRALDKAFGLGDAA